MSPINKGRTIEESRFDLHGDMEVEQDKGRANNSQTYKAKDNLRAVRQVGAAMCIGVRGEKVVVILYKGRRWRGVRTYGPKQTRQ